MAKVKKAKAKKTKSKRPRRTKAKTTKKREAVAATAESMAAKQRAISISEFFAKNRHLLGFDNPRKALLTAAKEAVDNSLDACEEGHILPDLVIDIKPIADNKFVLTVKDNGPGIVKQQIPNIFARLLYGSKFHSRKMSRGQQGIGISAAGMYGLLTTGEPVQIISRTSPKKSAHRFHEALHTAINETKIRAPSTDCISPIGAEQFQEGLGRVVKADFYTACSRSPAVYRGNPFLIEAALAYGMKDKYDGDLEKEPLMRLIRIANRVPLLYQRSACAIYKSVMDINWRNYALSQSARGGLPTGPVVLMVHIASVWVPFTSESKEAIAHYPEIIKEIQLAVQDCGRKLGIYLRRKKRIQQEQDKRRYIEIYLPYIGEALQHILTLKRKQVDAVLTKLKIVLEKTRKI